MLKATLTYTKEFNFKWVKKYALSGILLLAGVAAAYSNTLDVSEPPLDPVVIEVPGPIEYVKVPVPVPVAVPVPVPGPTKYVKVPVPGPIEYVECDSIWNHFSSPNKSHKLWWEEGNGGKGGRESDPSPSPGPDPSPDPDPGPSPDPDPGPDPSPDPGPDDECDNTGHSGPGQGHSNSPGRGHDRGGGRGW